MGPFLPYCRARHISPLCSFWRHDGAIKVPRRGLGNRRSMQYSVGDELKEAGKGGRGANPICVSSYGQDRDKVVGFGKMTFPFARQLSPSPKSAFTRLSVVKHEESLVRPPPRSIIVCVLRPGRFVLARPSESLPAAISN